MAIIPKKMKGFVIFLLTVLGRFGRVFLLGPGGHLAPSSAGSDLSKSGNHRCGRTSSAEVYLVLIKIDLAVRRKFTPEQEHMSVRETVV